MNIDQYRAFKAQQEAEATQKTEQTQAAEEEKPTTEEVAPEETTEEKPTTESEEKPVEEKPTEEKLPDKIEISGIGEVSMEELKNGYLRQSDYTKKTQEVSRKSKEADEALALYNHLKQNPKLAEQFLQTKNLPPTLDPTNSKITELENKVYDMMLEKEIDVLQNKYSDFEAREVVKEAHEKKITNLEDAYFIVKARKQTGQPQDVVDKDKLKEELRKELLKEIEEERKSTQTVISSSDSNPVVKDDAPKLTEMESNVARNLKMSDEEYIKWRDIGKKT